MRTPSVLRTPSRHLHLAQVQVSIPLGAPKYDNVKSVRGFNVFIVGFGGIGIVRGNNLADYLKSRYNLPVHIITRKTLIQFWEKHPESQMALQRWFKIVQKTEFNSFAELRQVFPSADKFDHYIIFNIGGNKYRLITSIHFNRGKVYIRHVLTHAEYDRGDWKNDPRK